MSFLDKIKRIDMKLVNLTKNVVNSVDEFEIGSLEISFVFEKMHESNFN